MKRDKEIRVDVRGRTNLNGVRTQKHERYLAEEDPDGTIILTPALLVPAKRLQPETGPEIMQSLETLREYFPGAEIVP